MGPTTIKALVLRGIDGIDGDQKGGTASVVGSTPQYSRLKCMPIRLV
jgi:hypothetical protein